MKIPFNVGEEYHRGKDLHDKLGGSRQAGMSTSAQHPVMFIFSGPGGEQHGYEDRFTADGRFLYTGEGQVGNMTFTRGNLALRNHLQDERHVLLFTQTRKGYCRYEGEFSFLDFQMASRPDRNGNIREAIIFELAFEKLEVAKSIPSKVDGDEKLPKLTKNLDLKQLRQIAISGSSPSVKVNSVRARQYYRSNAVKQYALLRSKGICENCNNPAPFLSKGKAPYLEVHHLNRLSDDGADTPEGVAAICPNCHRNIHIGENGNSVNDQLKLKIADKENELIKQNPSAKKIKENQ